MAEDRKIVHIVDTISSISIQQLAVEAIVDADLGFKIWGGKDADGNVTKWLAKDKPIQVTTATLTGGTTTGSDGLVRHDANGLLSGGWILISDLNDLISDADLASILDDAYNNDYGERTVTVDDGDVSWDLAGAYSFNIDLTNTTGGSDGFVVSDTFAEHWKLLRVEDAGIDLEAALKNITYAASAAVILSAGATDDLSFRAREGTVTLNEVGETTLDTTSQSLVGAINELFALDHVITLDDAYNNDAGAAAVTVDAGDVSWNLAGAYSFNLNLENATGISDGFWVNTSGGEDKDFFNILKVDTDKLNLNALLEEVVIETAGGVAFECAGAFDLSCSNIDLSASTLTIKGTTKITTEAAENLNIVPGAGGITVIGDAGSPGHLSTPTNDDAYIAGRLEVDGTAYFDGQSNFYSNIVLPNSSVIYTSTATGGLYPNLTSQTNLPMAFALGENARTLLICEYADRLVNFEHDVQDNNTIILHSSDATDITQWGSLTHDQTDFIINQGAGTTKLAGGVSLNVTTVNAATYDLLITDHILHVTYTVTGAVTSLTLPTAQTTAGRVIHIKDAGGNAATNNITIDTQGAETIDGAATLVIARDYACRSLYSDGSNWFIY